MIPRMWQILFKYETFLKLNALKLLTPKAYEGDSSLHLYRNEMGTVQLFMPLESKFDFLVYFVYYALLLVNIEFWRCYTSWLTFCWCLSVFLMYLPIIFLFFCVWNTCKKWSMEDLRIILNNGMWSDFSIVCLRTMGAEILSNAEFLQSTAWLNLKGPF